LIAELFEVRGFGEGLLSFIEQHVCEFVSERESLTACTIGAQHNFVPVLHTAGFSERVKVSGDRETHAMALRDESWLDGKCVDEPEDLIGNRLDCFVERLLLCASDEVPFGRSKNSSRLAAFAS